MSVENHAIGETLARAAGPAVGQFRLDLESGVWWWSAETYRMHGFEPGEVVPTSSLVLAHKHPEDRERVRRLLEDAQVTGDPFSSMHRIMDARGKDRTLVVVGQGRRDQATGDVVELMGYFVDITAPVSGRAQELARRDIAAAAQHRGPIEQAKGILIAVLGIDADEAFARLRQTSNNHNVPLRQLARLVVDEAERNAGDCADGIGVLLR